MPVIIQQKPLPADIGDPADYKWTSHALIRCEQRNIGHLEVVAAIEHPDYSSSNRNPTTPGSQVIYRGDVKVTYKPAEKLIITVAGRNDNGYVRVPLQNEREIKPPMAVNEVVAITIYEAWRKTLDSMLPGTTVKASDIYNMYGKELEEQYGGVRKSILSNLAAKASQFVAAGEIEKVPVYGGGWRKIGRIAPAQRPATLATPHDVALALSGVTPQNREEETDTTTEEEVEVSDQTLVPTQREDIPTVDGVLVDNTNVSGREKVQQAASALSAAVRAAGATFTYMEDSTKISFDITLPE